MKKKQEKKQKKQKKAGRSSTKSGGGSKRQLPSSTAIGEMARRFTPGEMEKLRQVLLEKRCELLDDIERLHNDAKCVTSSGESTSESPVPTHMAERGSDTWEQELTYRLIENKEALLREIDDALLRIADSTYGICQASRKPIAKSRLRFIPWAKYCIEYAWKGEIALA